MLSRCRSRYLSLQISVCFYVSHLKQENENGKENAAPINTFHKALLKAKDADHATSTTPIQNKPYPSQQPKEGEHKAPFEEFGVFPPAVTPAIIPSPPDQSGPLNRTVELLAPSHSEQNELSVIAEDDENAERSRISIHLSSRGTGDSALAEQNMNITASSSDTFHSISLDSPHPPLPEKSEVLQMSPPSHAVPIYDVPSVKPQQQAENYTAPLPEILPWNPPNIHDDAMTEPLPGPPAASTSTLVHIAEAAPGGNLGLADASPFDSKPVVSLFPALPAPMPLRKSMRTPRDPSMGMATPGATLGGRTSWLKKAREVKAMEGTGRSLSTTAAAGPSVSSMSSLPNALKRKSGDALTLPGITGLESEERRHKSTKNVEGDIAPLKPRAAEPAHEETPERQPSPRPPQIQHPHAEQEGMLDRFKRTVEGLGARVGKSMGKSLGAGAAASALAEARAAAEARVAERNHKEDELTRAMGVPVPAPTRDALVLATDSQTAKSRDDEGTELISSQGVEKRLSISDLFPPNDGKAKVKSKASEKVFQFAPAVQQTPSDRSKSNRDSTTTTPPDSPPSTRPSSFDLRPLPVVFNKPAPVFVPPVLASKPIVAAATVKTFGAFQVNDIPNSEPISLGFAPRPPSPKQAIPLSAQSTLESVKPDSLFDDDVPAWLPATQETEYSSRFGSQSQDQNANVLDEDDSWPMDEKLAAGVEWTFGVGLGKEDSMTWSTLPSQSQRADTGPMNKDNSVAVARAETEAHQTTGVIPGAFDDIDMYAEEYEAVGEAGDSELEEIVMAGRSTVSFVEVRFLPYYIFGDAHPFCSPNLTEVRARCRWSLLCLHSLNLGSLGKPRSY
jgi:hypothetical protein